MNAERDGADIKFEMAEPVSVTDGGRVIPFPMTGESCRIDGKGQKHFMYVCFVCLDIFESPGHRRFYRSGDGLPVCSESCRRRRDAGYNRSYNAVWDVWQTMPMPPSGISDDD